MKNNASLVYNFCLVIGDFIALLLAFIGAYLIRSHINSAPVAYPVHIATYIGVFSVLLPLWLILFGLIGLYDNNIYEKRFQESGLLVVGSFIGVLFVVFWNYLALHPILPSKLVPLYGFILAFVFLVIFRNLARLVRTALFSYEIGLNKVMVVGDNATSYELIDSLSDSRRSGYKVLAVVGDKEVVGNSRQKIPLFRHFQEALDKIKEPINTIFQTELYANETHNREVLEYAQTHHVAYRFVPGNTELFVGNIDVELFRNSVPVIAVHQTALIGWGRIVKRSFDFFMSLILLVIASPFILIAMVLIRCTSRGPIFFKQVRLTRFNQEFITYKFRTLKATYNGISPEEGFSKMDRKDLIKTYRDNGDWVPNDPRFTRLGRFIRRYSIDELPQLFNVLVGDISLVGPRALVPEELSLYDKRHAILSVKSGLTGLAQVSGRRHISFDERRKLDLYYVQNWSFWLDLIILAKTFRVVIEAIGAQ